MTKLNKAQIVPALLWDLCAVESASYECENMIDFICHQLTSAGAVFHADQHGNIYAMNDPGLPLIVAHMDTVHAITGHLTPVVVGDNITGMNSATMKPQGIGGDDKVGIFIALTLFFEGRVNAAFFVDEETGCEGSGNADMAWIKDVAAAPYVLQCDRRGNSDFITDISGPICSKAFRKSIAPHLKRYGYRTERGMMTDVMALSDNGVGVSCANMSCGYYRPHQADEYINLPDVLNCLEMCRDIVTYVRERYPHTRQAPKYNGWSFKDWDDPRTWASSAKTNSRVKDVGMGSEIERLQGYERVSISSLTDQQFEDYSYLYDKYRLK